MNRAWRQVFAREWKSVCRGTELTWMLVWLPMLLSVVVVLVFYEGRLVGLPLGVVDHAGSSLSRELLRRVEALPSIAGIPFTDEGQAQQAMRRGEIYGFLVIPPDLDARIASMEPVAVSAFINGQMLQEAVIYKGAVSEIPFFVLGIMGFLGWLIAGLLLRSRCIDQRYWNKT